MHHDETFWGNPRTWVGVAFVIFIVLFGRVIWRALAKILDARTESVRASLDEAARLRREAEAMLKDAEAQRQAAMAEAQRLLEGAKAQASQVAAQTAAEAEASARRREQMAIDRIAAAEKAAVDDIRTMAAEIATAATRDVLAKGLTAEADARLVDTAISQLPSALATRRAA